MSLSVRFCIKAFCETLKPEFNFTEAGKTELDQHTGRLAANLSSEVVLQTQEAKAAIDKHTGCHSYQLCSPYLLNIRNVIGV